MELIMEHRKVIEMEMAMVDLLVQCSEYLMDNGSGQKWASLKELLWDIQMELMMERLKAMEFELQMGYLTE